MSLESFEITLNPNQKERPCGLRAKLNVYDDAVYIIPIPNEKPIKIIAENPWQFKDLGDYELAISRPATEEEKEAFLNYIEEYFKESKR